MKIAIKTLGCKINQYESSCILEPFVNDGYAVVPFESEADIYIVNTCTVTNRTDFKSRNFIRKALKHKESNPHIKIVVTGCFAQREPEQIEDMGEIDYIVDNQQKGLIYSLLKTQKFEFHDILTEQYFPEMQTSAMNEHSRVFLKVQDGCDFYCSYCAIPYARGHSRSREPEKVIEQVELLTKQGYHEFVLGGINMGLYGRDLNQGYYLESLIKDISSVSGVELIRLSSVEPQLFTDGMKQEIERNSKICSHLHIPLQSGCDTILKAMKRRYTTSQFISQINDLLSIRPDLALGFDVITGFPGETDKLFSETFEFLENIPFTYLHNFTYSRRNGTPAAKLKGQVNGKVANERVNRMEALSQNKKQVYTRRLVDDKILLRGVVENINSGIWTSLSDHYIRMNGENCDVKQGDMISIVPTIIQKDGVEVK